MAKKAKTTEDFIKQSILKHGNKYDYSKSLYVNHNEKLIIICPIHGEFLQKPSSHTRGQGCKKCADSNKAMNIEFVIEFLNKINILLLSNEYNNTHENLKFKCNICEHEWNTSFHAIHRAGTRCPKCSNRAKKTLEEIQEYIEKKDITLLSTKYKNSSSKLKLKCGVCENEWKACWDNLKANKGCPECARKIQGGFGSLTIKLADRNKEDWINKEALIYIMNCHDDVENFYKIGVTTKSIKKRFKDTKSMPYDYKIIEIVNTNLYNATLLEKELHKINKHNKYIPNIKFGGYTECFSNINLKDIKLIIKKERL